MPVDDSLDEPVALPLGAAERDAEILGVPLGVREGDDDVELSVEPLGAAAVTL